MLFAILPILFFPLFTADMARFLTLVTFFLADFAAVFAVVTMFFAAVFALVTIFFAATFALATTFFAAVLANFFAPSLPSVANWAFIFPKSSGFINTYRPAFFQCIAKQPMKHTNVRPHIMVVDASEYFASTYIMLSISITIHTTIFIPAGISGAGIIRF